MRRNLQIFGDRQMNEKVVKFDNFCWRNTNFFFFRSSRQINSEKSGMWKMSDRTRRTRFRLIWDPLGPRGSSQPPGPGSPSLIGRPKPRPRPPKQGPFIEKASVRLSLTLSCHPLVRQLTWSETLVFGRTHHFAILRFFEDFTFEKKENAEPVNPSNSFILWLVIG